MATFLWRRRGRATFGATALLVLLFVLVGIRSEPPAHAVAGGDPYIVLPVVDTDPDPNIVETTITAEPANVDVGGGVIASVLTFNGSVPGPEFRLKVGDTVIVHFVNNIAHPTGIHWHGIELANASDGTPLTQNMVEPEETFEYKFTVTRPGIFWYHPHHHSSTNQVFKGMYGSIIVTDPHEAALVAANVLPTAAQTKTFLLSDITVCKTAGSNDDETFDLTPGALPHVSGADLSGQQGADPIDLCELAPIDEDGNPRPLPGGIYLNGEVPNIQIAGLSGPVNEGQTVLLNGKNVGARAGTPASPQALAPGASTLDVEAGQGIRLQLISAATTRFFRLLLTDQSGAQVPLVRVGGQGGLLDSAHKEGGVVSGFDFKYTNGEILLDPGDRQDVVAVIPAGANQGDVLTLWTQDFPRLGTGFANTPTVPVAHFEVTGVAAVPSTVDEGTLLRSHPAVLAPQEILGAATGTVLDPTTFNPVKPGLATPNIMLSNILVTAVGNRLGINGYHGSHDFPGDFTAIPHEDSARYARLHDTLEMSVTNVTNAHHPFHLHGFSIQPITLTDTDAAASPLGNAPAVTGPSYTFPRTEYRDNIDIPPGYTLTFRVRLDDRPMMDGTTPGGGVGRWVLHCHIFFHAVFGMISEFVVVQPPGVTVADAAGNEGAAIPIHTTAFDDDGDPMTTTWSFAPLAGVDPGATCVIADPSALNTTITCTDDGTYTLTVTANDGVNPAVVQNATLTVSNVSPTVLITSITPSLLVQVGTNVTINASISDPASNDTLTCSFDLDDGAPPVIVAPVAGACSTSKVFTAAGVYTVTVTGTDDDGGAGSSSALLIVFDPDAGFVTGGGTIDSPAGAYPADPSLTGTAHFGFFSKYQKGTTVPTGETHFQFQAASFNFKATAYQWLVVAGAKAQYKGTGQVNNAGNFGFLLTVVDGALPGGGGFDKFRLKVWDIATSTIVYDNVLGGSDDMDIANPTVIASGSIVIHAPKK
jgi:FtsP/CotA-like multicopper oxidase with cupredoxin domain